ncbi:PAS domain-containing sensor histidine kinase [Fictibacillus phosphorivorans]|uniref:PAS domain-containing sensor histidine kinase n=1 Tax=Fictibacillus phosphorivorans TaxID=1221500 RepID=UPI00203CBDB1|nr:PAS domain S-box protein [Fictibacillus phosphorivorans]MCM3718446.1 PAS domain S-box protein [Fictibacillus phosphorivorans]MCM3776070.1 PAS domain S-box protein [Fictibacillus phosphorivorans]
MAKKGETGIVEANKKDMKYIQDFIDQLSEAVVLVSPNMKIAAVNQHFRKLRKDEVSFVGKAVDEIILRHKDRKEGTLLTEKGFLSVKISEGLLPVEGAFFQYLILKEQPAIVHSCQEPLLKTLMDIVPDFIGIKDGDGRFLFANKFVSELFELEGFDFTGKTDADLAEVKPYFNDVFQYCIKTDEQVWQAKEIVRCEEFVPARDGSTRFFDVYKIPVFNPEGSRKNLLIFGREVTEKIKSRLLLEESEARYRLLAENAMDMITTHSKDGTYTYVSPACETLLGRKAQDLIGQTVYLILHPDDEGAARKIHEKLIEGPCTSTIQFRLLHKEGHYVWLETSCKSICDDTGNVVEIIGVTRDISERKKSEEMLRQSDKLSIVGQLAASVAHEIRNPLTSLKGFIQLFQECNEIDAANYYGIMHKELNRIDQIMGQLLLLAKPQMKSYKKISIHELVQFVETLLQPEALAQHVEIRSDLCEKIPHVKAEENELKQVLINVVKNAMDSMEKGGTISIKGKQVDDAIHLTIKDQGCGISPDHLARLGEPFYTTKEKGTGLGLMVSSKIMKEHKGELKFHSEKGKGTTVSLILPV